MNTIKNQPTCNIFSKGNTRTLKLHYGMNVKYVCPTSQVFQVSPSHGSPLSWPLVREHCAPWRLLLWRWEFAGSHLCSAAWEWEREGGEKEEWELYILWFCVFLGYLNTMWLRRKTCFHKEEIDFAGVNGSTLTFTMKPVIWLSGLFGLAMHEPFSQML